MTDIEPFRLVETKPGNHSLLLTNFATSAGVFAEAGRPGGGYDWEIVAQGVLRHDAPELIERVSFDPEGSMFCARAIDRDALARLGALLAALVRDPVALRAAITRIPKEDWD